MKLNQVRYFVSRIGIEKVELIKRDSESKDKYVEVHHRGTVDYNGNEICPASGKSFVRREDLFFTLEEAVAFAKKKDEDTFRRYTEEIKTLKDLVEFPIRYSFNDEDGCQDGLIVDAYKKRAEELLGIQLD